MGKLRQVAKPDSAKISGISDGAGVRGTLWVLSGEVCFSVRCESRDKVELASQPHEKQKSAEGIVVAGRRQRPEFSVC